MTPVTCLCCQLYRLNFQIRKPEGEKRVSRGRKVKQETMALEVLLVPKESSAVEAALAT